MSLHRYLPKDVWEYYKIHKWFPLDITSKELSQVLEVHSVIPHEENDEDLFIQFKKDMETLFKKLWKAVVNREDVKKVCREMFEEEKI